MTAFIAVTSLASAQQVQRITPNFKDADITQIIEAVSAATGKNFIIDPRVRAQVTMLSSTPMTPAAFYEAFLAILQVHGFIAVPAGNIVKILPDANARQIPSVDLPDHVSATSDEIVTQVVDVKNVSAAQLVPILRPLIPQYGQLAAYPASNILIISDRAANVNRIIRILRRIDQVGDTDVEIVPLQNASSAEIVRVINSLYQGAGQQGAEGALAAKVVADERSNSVLISGDQSQRLRIRALVAHLDTPLEAGGDTQVRYLHYADAEKIAPKLKEQITGVAQAAAGSGQNAGASPQAQAEKSAMIWADKQNNALVITAPPKIMRAVMNIIDKLDIRRPQVLVEAVIVEVTADKSAELGVNWAAFSKDSNTNVPAGAFVSPVGGTSIVDLANSVSGVINGRTGSTTGTTSATIPQGTTLAIGRLAAGGLNFAAMLRAIRNDTDTNVIATPSTVTLDNQEAEIKVAQEVPYITGSYTNTGAAGGAVSPFQTVQREEVGTILKVTPQIAAEGNSVVLKISIESSSVLPTSLSSVDITVSKRTISTNVLIDDGGVVVLGGLIQDEASKANQRVPFLGSIPLIGLAFKTRQANATKNNLMMFIRPKILRDETQAAFETDSKYNYMQDQQKSYNQREILPLLPGVPKPKLQPAPPPPPPGSTPTAATSPEEKAKQAKEQADADAAAARKLQAAPSSKPAPPNAAPAPSSAPPVSQPAPDPQAQDAPTPQAPTPPPGGNP
ncbi:MAG TPA: type II secretion system secretin GspD [Steroidobacteraceae bacterium]|nr:type II secretion system secretin GspD [Steroidobacteraceae bacterium]